MRLPRPTTLIPTALALALASGWAAREAAFAQEKARAKELASRTIPLDEVKMAEYRDPQGRPAGRIGLYLSGDTPASTQFVTGRLVLDPGKSPHPPHTHVEEEVMIIERGHGKITCDGQVTEVGPGSVMYTAPNAPHGIDNTGDEPIVFYFIKWESKAKGQ